jgi:triphosphatase
MMHRARELEAAFVVPAASALSKLPRTLTSLSSSVHRRGTQRSRDLYLDTADRFFLRAGSACRLRMRGPRAQVALKSLSAFRNGIAARMEMEETLPARPGEFPAPFPGREINAWLRPLAGRLTIQPLFEIRQCRTVYDVRLKHGTSLQVSADALTVSENVASCGTWIEVELMQGEPRDLLAFARALRSALGLTPARQSKFEYGLEWTGVTKPVLDEGPEFDSRPADRVDEMACRTLNLHFRRMLWHEPGTRLGLNPDALHDMRVATRRMRAALRVFAGSVPPSVASRLQADLHWIAAALGRMRDLDVYRQGLSEDMQRLPESSRQLMSRYLNTLEAEATRGRSALLRVLRSQRFARFAVDTAALLETGFRRRSGNRDARLSAAACAREQIRTVLKKALKAGRKLDPQSPDEALHRFRIKCKRLRYTCEFFAAVCGKEAARFARRVAELQDILGAHHDAVVARRMIEQFMASHPSGTRLSGTLCFAMGQLAAWKQDQIRNERQAFFKAWREFDRKKVRRPLLSQLLSLRPVRPRQRLAKRMGSAGA